MFAHPKMKVMFYLFCFFYDILIYICSQFGLKALLHPSILVNPYKNCKSESTSKGYSLSPSLGQCKARPFNYHRVCFFVSFFICFSATTDWLLVKYIKSMLKQYWPPWINLLRDADFSCTSYISSYISKLLYFVLILTGPRRVWIYNIERSHPSHIIYPPVEKRHDRYGIISSNHQIRILNVLETLY